MERLSLTTSSPVFSLCSISVRRSIKKEAWRRTRNARTENWTSFSGTFSGTKTDLLTTPQSTWLPPLVCFLLLIHWIAHLYSPEFMISDKLLDPLKWSRQSEGKFSSKFSYTHCSIKGKETLKSYFKKLQMQLFHDYIMVKENFSWSFIAPLPSPTPSFSFLVFKFPQ